MAPERKPKILVVACADSPLLRARALVPVAGGVDVVWFSESRQIPQGECQIVHSPLTNCWGRLLTWLRFLLVYSRERPDLLHVHWAVFPPLLLRSSWKNLIVTPMGSDILLPGLLGFRQWIVKRVLARANVVTSKSEFMDDSLKKLGVDKGRMTRMTWGVAEEFFALRERRCDSRIQLGIADPTTVFFSPRALKPLYRVDLIIGAFVEFLRNGGDGVLLVSEMFGDDRTGMRLRELAGEYVAAKRIRFLGSLTTDEMKTCYAVVSFAASDGMPQTLYETMAAGCFPVFTDLPQYHALLVHEKNSFLCRMDDGRSLLDGFRHAARVTHGYWDPSINCRKAHRQFSERTETARMNDIYRELLS